MFDERRVGFAHGFCTIFLSPHSLSIKQWVELTSLDTRPVDQICPLCATQQLLRRISHPNGNIQQLFRGDLSSRRAVRLFRILYFATIDLAKCVKQKLWQSREVPLTCSALKLGHSHQVSRCFADEIHF